MPADIRIIHAHEFLDATPDGQFDLEKSKEVLLAVAAKSAPSNEFDVLLDTRQAHSDMSVDDLWYLAAELHQSREAFSHKTAVLVSPSQLDYAAFFALCAQERGFDVSAFTSLGEAVAWLVGA